MLRSKTLQHWLKYTLFQLVLSSLIFCWYFGFLLFGSVISLPSREKPNLTAFWQRFHPLRFLSSLALRLLQDCEAEKRLFSVLPRCCLFQMRYNWLSKRPGLFRLLLSCFVKSSPTHLKFKVKRKIFKNFACENLKNTLLTFEQLRTFESGLRSGVKILAESSANFWKNFPI